MHMQIPKGSLVIWNLYYRFKTDISQYFFPVEKEGCNLADKSSVNPVILTDVNPAYGEVKNTDTTRTVYDTVQ